MYNLFGLFIVTVYNETKDKNASDSAKYKKGHNDTWDSYHPVFDIVFPTLPS